jgi:hypothetical protein
MLLQHVVLAVTLHALNWYLEMPSHAVQERHVVECNDDEYVKPEMQLLHADDRVAEEY